MSRNLASLIMKSLSKDPDQRFQTGMRWRKLSKPVNRGESRIRHTGKGFLMNAGKGLLKGTNASF